YQRITLSSLQPAVAGYAAAVVEHLHSCFGHADVHAFTNQVVGDGILVPTVRDKIVARNLGDRPDSGFKGTIRQPQHVGLFFFQIGAATAASHLLERAAVQFFQLFGDRLIQFPQGKEFAVAQSSYDPRLSKADRCLCRTFVPWLADTGWYDRRAVMLGKFLVAAI